MGSGIVDYHVRLLCSSASYNSWGATNTAQRNNAGYVATPLDYADGIASRVRY